MNPALLSSERMDWATPDSILDRIERLGTIAFDPAWPPVRSAVGSRDGLNATWRGYGLAFCNPEYGRDIARWTAKGAREFWIPPIEGSEHPPPDHLVMLVPARTDTKWWHENILRADVLCMIRGRLQFVGAPHPAPFPSALAYWGWQPERFIEIFAPMGWIVRRD